MLINILLVSVFELGLQRVANAVVKVPDSLIILSEK